ncbi:hypothetical protein [Arthrobacter sp. TMS2-4]
MSDATTEEIMRNTTNRMLLGLVIGLSFSNAALVLSLPAVFGPHKPTMSGWP